MAQTEERTHLRMTSTNPMTVFIHGSEDKIMGDCKDISKTGFAFISEDKISINKKITADIKTTDLPFPPMQYTGHVVRCTNLEGGLFEIAVKASP